MATEPAGPPLVMGTRHIASTQESRRGIAQRAREIGFSSEEIREIERLYVNLSGEAKL